MATKKETNPSKSLGVKKKRVVLLDSHAIMHRAYHALPEFTSDTGEPTGALYGLAAMLIKIVKELKPDHLIAAADMAGPTHRHDVYEAYKGTRTETDQALAMQLDRAGEVYDAFGIPSFGLPGYEADDIIGTLAKRFGKGKNTEVIIATGDNDTLQLVGEEDVRVYTLRKGLSDTVLYDAGKVREKYGFGPEHITDLKGIAGDPSDNIKGVPGVGDGSARKLIIAYGSLEKILKALKKEGVEAVAKKAGIQKRYAQLVLDGEDDAIFSKMLATIKTDVPVSYELPDETWEASFDLDRALTFCDTVGFRSLIPRIRQMAGEKVETSSVAAAAVQEDAEDEEFLEEACVALWLLHSDMTNPTREDVLRTTRASTLEEALPLLVKALRETGRLLEVFETIEKPLIPIVKEMQRHGITVDTKHLARLSAQYHDELEGIVTRIYEAAGHEFNINSPKQLGAVLFDELRLGGGKQKTTSTGQRSTREDELEKLREEHPIIGAILEYRELQKLLSTYVDTLPNLVAEDGRVHARFIQTGAVTGRMASQDPNLQNIPTKPGYGLPIRDAFVASPGFTLVAIDYSQIELRIAAGLSGDEKLIDVFTKGGDIHAAVAANVFNVPPEMVDAEMRRRAKVINFGILYGMGVNALRANLGEAVSRTDAAQYLNEYFKTYSGLADYVEHVKARAAREGYTETLFGRRRTFAGFASPLPYVRAAAERMAVNAPIQGTQADIIKLAMVRAEKLLQDEDARDDAHLLLQVHDELVYEIREDRAKELAVRIRGVMEHVVAPEDLSGVPVIAEVRAGERWGSLKKIPRSELLA